MNECINTRGVQTTASGTRDLASTREEPAIVTVMPMRDPGCLEARAVAKQIYDGWQSPGAMGPCNTIHTLLPVSCAR